MADDARPPLFRLTFVRDDPALGWLSLLARVWVAAAGLSLWLLWVGFLATPWIVSMTVSPRVAAAIGVRDPSDAQYAGQLAIYIVAIIAASLFPLTRWASLQLRNRVMLGLVRKGVVAGALAIDDLSKLGDAPADRPISVVGWVRGRSHLPYQVDGKPCVGLALGCRAHVLETLTGPRRDLWTGRRTETQWVQRHSELMEVLCDFDLVDDAGHSIPIGVARARLIGDRNVDLVGDDVDERALLGWLRLPSNVRALGRKAFALRDGDPVMVVGFRPGPTDDQGAPAAAPTFAVAALVSAPAVPLLVYGLRAERRPDLA